MSRARRANIASVADALALALVHIFRAKEGRCRSLPSIGDDRPQTEPGDSPRYCVGVSGIDPVRSWLPVTIQHAHHSRSRFR